MNISDTPITDALNIKWKAYTDLGISNKPITFEELAQQLERKLNEAKAACAVLRKALVELAKLCNGDIGNSVGNVIAQEALSTTTAGTDLLKELEELRKDKERLDWLQAQDFSLYSDPEQAMRFSLAIQQDGVTESIHESVSSLRTAIDQAKDKQ
jgi:hypothetical protein